MRRALAITSVALITAGIVVLADAALTLAWKEPASALYASLKQGAARGELEDLEASFEASGVDFAAHARRYARELEDGKGMASLSIPSAGIDQVVVEGTDEQSLQRGPAHYEDTKLPGQGTTVAIAGHRTTYGAPFRKIDKIEQGDRVRVELPYGEFVYEVSKTRIVQPSDVQIIRDTGRERLVLTACHPLYSAAERYAVFAELVSAEPRGT